MEQVKDISDLAGFPLAVNLVDGMLLLGNGVTSDPPGARTYEEMRLLFADATANGLAVLYHLYRAVRRDRDKQVLERAGLRYDITITMPGTINGEYIKTAGHYHSRGPAGITYPEIYEVLHGQAAFLLQKVDNSEHLTPQIQEVWLVICKAGEKIVIPPDCGHVTINIGAEPLVVSDLIALESQNVYTSFHQLRGAAYYLLQDQSQPEDVRFIQNPNYIHALPAPRLLSGSRWRPFLLNEKPLYALFITSPDIFDFLRNPGSSMEQIFDLWHK